MEQIKIRELFCHITGPLVSQYLLKKTDMLNGLIVPYDPAGNQCCSIARLNGMKMDVRHHIERELQEEKRLVAKKFASL